MLKNKFILAILCFTLILLAVGCDAGTDIVETGRPSGVSQEIQTSLPEADQKPESDNSEIEEEFNIPYPLEMYFSSGAGAWATNITINADGSFFGDYHDSNMGDTGPDYPNGTVYECKFSGQFSTLRQVNDYTFSLTLEAIEYEGEIDASRIENGILYNFTYPYGLMNVDNTAPAKSFLLYTPDAPTEALRDEFISWWPERFGAEAGGSLLIYGLCNTETDEGFFTAKNE